MKSAALTPEAIETLILVSEEGSFAAAARKLGKVPSALTYSMRQLEDELDVLLFDRSSKRAQLTPAGKELLAEGQRLLLEIDSIANRVKRVATGWEPEFTIAFDGIVSQKIILELVTQFLSGNPPTRLRLRHEILSGTWETLARGEADIALGVTEPQSIPAGIQMEMMGNLDFVFTVSPNHPLAKERGPIGNDILIHHRAIAIADSARQFEPRTVGLLPGQDVLTVPTTAMKIQALLAGLGGGYIPKAMVQSYLDSGELIELNIQGTRHIPIGYAWRGGRNNKPASQTGGLALQWWLECLAKPSTQQSLLQGH
jgi:DNA-binding transcriptional LysR family regulator